MVDLAEEVLNVGLEDEPLSSGERHPDLLQGVGGRALRSKTEAHRQEVGLEDGFEDDLGRLLAHPVGDSGDAQWALGPVGLGDLHPAYSCRAIGACTEALTELIEHPITP